MAQRIHIPEHKNEYDYISITGVNGDFIVIWWDKQSKKILGRVTNPTNRQIDFPIEILELESHAISVNDLDICILDDKYVLVWKQQGNIPDFSEIYAAILHPSLEVAASPFSISETNGTENSVHSCKCTRLAPDRCLVTWYQTQRTGNTVICYRTAAVDGSLTGEIGKIGQPNPNIYPEFIAAPYGGLVLVWHVQASQVGFHRFNADGIADGESHIRNLKHKFSSTSFSVSHDDAAVTISFASKINNHETIISREYDLVNFDFNKEEQIILGASTVKNIDKIETSNIRYYSCVLSRELHVEEVHLISFNKNTSTVTDNTTLTVCYGALKSVCGMASSDSIFLSWTSRRHADESYGIYAIHQTLSGTKLPVGGNSDPDQILGTVKPFDDFFIPRDEATLDEEIYVVLPSGERQNIFPTLTLDNRYMFHPVCGSDALDLPVGLYPLTIEKVSISDQFPHPTSTVSYQIRAHIDQPFGTFEDEGLSNLEMAQEMVDILAPTTIFKYKHREIFVESISEFSGISLVHKFVKRIKSDFDKLDIKNNKIKYFRIAKSFESLVSNRLRQEFKFDPITAIVVALLIVLVTIFVFATFGALIREFAKSMGALSPAKNNDDVHESIKNHIKRENEKIKKEFESAIEKTTNESHGVLKASFSGKTIFNNPDGTREERRLSDFGMRFSVENGEVLELNPLFQLEGKITKNEISFKHKGQTDFDMKIEADSSCSADFRFVRQIPGGGNSITTGTLKGKLYNMPA